MTAIARQVWLVVTVAIVAASLGCAAEAPTGGATSEAAYAPLRAAPEGAVMLFNGQNVDNWHYSSGEPAMWPVADGVVTVSRGNIISNETFDDAWIHIEFKVPSMPNARGQGKGNSGIYVQGRYEIQVLDSYGLKVPGTGDCGAIYGQYAPLVNACKPPLEWQSFDIIFRAPRVDDSGTVTEPGRMTIFQNDVVIQNNAELAGVTPRAYGTTVAGAGPLVLQDHGAPVQYRNAWVVHLPPKGSDAYEGR
jgi:hypothetical protein